MIKIYVKILIFTKKVGEIVGEYKLPHFYYKMASRKDFKKTKFTGVYVKEDPKTKVKTYLARIKVMGVETEKIVGYSNDKYKTNPSLAFQKRVELINEVKAGRSISYSDNLTLDKLVDNFKEDRKNTLTKKKIEVYSSFYLKQFPIKTRSKKIKDIRKEDFQKIINAMIEKGYKPSYIETIKFLNPLFKKAVEDKTIDRNIMNDLDFPKYDKNRYFSLDQDKAKALYQEILNIPDKQYRAMFLFLLRGRRVNEVLTLEWQNIDLVNKKYTIVDSQSKIRKTLTFVLDEELLEALGHLNAKKEGLVFVSPVTGKKFYSFPKRLWQKIKDNVGIQDMKLHDFRHLLGFTLVNNGVELEKISRALGHSKITTTQMYSNQKEKMASEAVDSYLKLMK